MLSFDHHIKQIAGCFDITILNIYVLYISDAASS